MLLSRTARERLRMTPELDKTEGGFNQSREWGQNLAVVSFHSLIKFGNDHSSQKATLLKNFANQEMKRSGN